MDYLNYYKSLLEKYGDSPKAVSWGSKESQELRFKVLLEIGDFTGKHILDVGCGLGDLYGYMEKMGYTYFGYTGYDIVPEMIIAAKKKYPKAKFVDVFPEEKFDYVFESGIFNLPELDWGTNTAIVINKMFDVCKIGVGMNFLSSLSPKKNKDSQYTDPLEILRFVSELTDKFTLRHDYKNNDFCVYAFRNSPK